MPIIRAIHTASHGEPARHGEARNDALVVEREVAPGRFEAVDGPFARWQRTVRADADGTLEEVIDYRTAVPFWGRAVDLLLRRTVRSGLAPDATPWWSPPDRLNADHATVLSLCASLALLAGFLGGLITQTLTFVAKDLGGGAWTQSVSLSIIRVGALLTLGAMAMADRVGRRPLVRFSLDGAAIAALATAVAPDIWSVTAAQTVCRGLVAGAALLLPVICAEEMPARSRGFATGVLALAAGLGVGMVLWVLPVVDLAPWAWRAIYLLALPVLFATHRCIRRLPETAVRARRTARRLPRPAHARATARGARRRRVPPQRVRRSRRPAAERVPAHGTRLQRDRHRGVPAADQHLGRHRRRGWQPAVGPPVATAGGAIGLVGFGVGNVVMFATSGAAMWVASIVGSVVGAALVPSIGALLPELFPTLRRGAANGMLNIAGVLGSVAGLLTAGALVDPVGYGPTFALLALPLIIVVGLLHWIPETAGVELEILNPDDP